MLMTKYMYFVRKYVVKWVSSGEIAHIVGINGFSRLLYGALTAKKGETQMKGKNNK